ncbi:HAD-superfamily hydrolase-like protein [Cucurbitaria berberidis CBS 394.84]|uniref:HAD-superfamily hydrolase-like protein n=1 Tax=Cucurbitaria berberidis CBS 394.84 TaxID=1168544 RepID=A0A9P4GJZ3_9PLEO|nr:HAD-superfamily hydrolase-like protein [Cucurbitaria berberidis CBS 394.84]KAF1846536.1 HAD-superfamily hydrolase-like protein [Cucurbitaria berberidis CBS 394.84]
MGKAKYIMLDCDNTLVQSERLAFEACAELTNIVLENHKIDARYTAESLLEDFVGHNFRGMLQGLQKKHNFTMPQAELDDFVQRELGAVTRKLSEKAVECPGVTNELNKLKEQGYPMSVVSTSAKSRVVASIEKAGIAHFFPPQHVYSAATSLDPPSSKPDPAIYLYAAEQLGVKPHEAITVEDSKSGATAAMRAGIPCIGYVGIYGIEEGKDKMEQMAKLLTDETKCAAIMYDWKEFQDCLKKVEAKL